MQNTYLSENMREISRLSDSTVLCIYEPLDRLYIAKRVPKENRTLFEELKKINNPHIANVSIIDESENDLIIYTKYISGETLADIIEERGPLPQEEITKIAVEICDGLAQIHKKGIVHRDINPNNILISSDSVTKIIDFGIIRKNKPNVANDTLILGTPGYAAPEQFGFTQSSCRTDIYALGVLMNVMATGKLPNEKRATGKLGKVISKCIEIDSEKRFNTISEVQDALEEKSGVYGPIDKFLAAMPGLRSKNSIVVTLAVIGYLLLLLISVMIFSVIDDKNFRTIMLSIVAWITMIALPFMGFTNFLGIWNKLPFSKNSSRRSQRILYNILSIISIFIGFCFFAVANSKY
jgi:serine/threonine protein kinase